MKDKVVISPASNAPDSQRTVALASIGQILARKKLRPAPQPEPPRPARRPSYGPITYIFVPFPVELADLERRQSLPPAELHILALRRFANPITGEWLTSTQEVARLLRVDRSTAQKSLRSVEDRHFIHVRHLRSRTVQLQIYFGGFAQPGYRQEGMSPLRWDADFTADGAVPAHGWSQSYASTHSAGSQDSGSTEPTYVPDPEALGTLPKTKNVKEEKEDIRSKQLSPGGLGENSGLSPVSTFVPQIHDESVVQELARKLAEPYMNNFLALRRQYGLSRLERACVLAQDKLHDTKHPFRKRPGAYVRWLLNSGVC